MATAPLIQTDQALRELCQRLEGAERIGFDTEFVPEYNYAPKLCLIQLVTDDELAIVDPLAVSDLSRFWQILLDPQRELVAHAAGAELAFCMRLGGALPERLFDVQLAAGLTGLGYPLSYAKLVHKMLDVTLQKGAARTDWRKRPLSNEQLRYALDDVLYLFPVRDKLGERCHRLNRGQWVQEENGRIQRILWKRAQEPLWTRVSGARSLNRRELAVLQELARWRDLRARMADRPTKWVLRDDLLVELARRQPRSAEALRRTRGLGGFKEGAQTRAVLEAIQVGQRLPESQCPDVKRHRRKEHPNEKMIVKLLGAVMIHLAELHQCAPSLLGNTADLEALVAWYFDGRKGALPNILTGWRGVICGRPLLDFLAGRTSLSLGQQTDVPELRFW